MGNLLQVASSTAIKTGGHICPTGGKNAPRRKSVDRKFAAVAKVLWPNNTAAHIAATARKEISFGKRLLRGQGEIPASVVIACVTEMLRQQD